MSTKSNIYTIICEDFTKERKEKTLSIEYGELYNLFITGTVREVG